MTVLVRSNALRKSRLGHSGPLTVIEVSVALCHANTSIRPRFASSIAALGLVTRIVLKDQASDDLHTPGLAYLTVLPI